MRARTLTDFRNFLLKRTRGLNDEVIWKLRKKFNRRVFSQIPSGKKACITIFHDYERGYAGRKAEAYSDIGLNFILNCEKKYGIKATYNIVGKICESHPSTVSRIAEEGHEIASHSYSHKDLWKLSHEEIREEVTKSVEVFKDLGIQISGFRSPWNRWNSRLIRILSEEKFLWNAEGLWDSGNPWYLEGELLRIPTDQDDWAYEGQRARPREMLEKFINDIRFAKTKNLYLAIGFHPWIEGISDDRLKTFRKLIEKLAQDKDIIIKTFGEIAKFVKNSSARRESNAKG